MQVNEITDGVIGVAIEVHRALGPGLLESAYVQCGYRVDMLVADTVVVEVKAVERLAPVMKPNF